MNGPCMCGDPACPKCGNPARLVEQEQMQDEFEALQADLSLQDWKIVVRVGLAGLAAARDAIAIDRAAQLEIEAETEATKGFPDERDFDYIEQAEGESRCSLKPDVVIERDAFPDMAYREGKPVRIVAQTMLELITPNQLVHLRKLALELDVELNYQVHGLWKVKAEELTREAGTWLSGYLEGALAAKNRSRVKETPAKAVPEISKLSELAFPGFRDVIASGYAGVDPQGRIVDRRICPESVPMQANKLLGVPRPKSLPAAKETPGKGILDGDLDRDNKIG